MGPPFLFDDTVPICITTITPTQYLRATVYGKTGMCNSFICFYMRFVRDVQNVPFR